jgi:hypothetical protein
MNDGIDSEKKIDIIAQFIVKNDMGTPAILFLESFKSIFWLGGVYGLLFLSPFLPFYGKEWDEFMYLLQERENIEILIERIEEFIKLKDLEKTNKKSGGVINKIEKLFGFKNKLSFANFKLNLYL